MINLPNNKVKNSFFQKSFTINCGGKLLSIDQPIVMGILNITPDSFYDGGQYTVQSSILKRTSQIIEEGGKIIDVGAFSSRPGSKMPSIEEERRRLIPALEIIRKNFPDVIISVDTYRSAIAREVVDKFGVQIINDISAGEMDSNMFATIGELKVPYIMMHMKGTPENMQNNPHYDNLMQEISLYFAEKTDKLKLLGVNDIIIDPGFGFGKTIDHNYQLLNNLHEFKAFELPVLVGISRKSMIYKFLNSTPQEALNGTTALHTIALLNGAHILRVHDVKEAVETIKLVGKLKENA